MHSCLHLKEPITVSPPLLERSRTEVAGISKIALIVGVIFSAGSELSERRSADNNGDCMRWLVDDPVL